MVAFFALTYAVAWTCFIPVALRISPRTLVGGALLLLGTFAPSLAAIALTAPRRRDRGAHAGKPHRSRWRRAAVNNSKDIVPSATPGAAATFSLHASTIGWITVALLWICAAGFLFDMARRADETRPAATPDTTIPT